MCNTNVFLIAALFQFYCATAYVMKPKETLMEIAEDEEPIFPHFAVKIDDQPTRGNEEKQSVSLKEKVLRFLGSPESKENSRFVPIEHFDESADKSIRNRRQMGEFNKMFYGIQDRLAAQNFKDRFNLSRTSEAECMLVLIRLGIQTQEDFFRARRICSESF